MSKLADIQSHFSSSQTKYRRRDGHRYADIKGYEGLYLICDQGYVVNLKKCSELWGYSRGGGLYVGLYDQYGGLKQWPVGKLVLTAFVPYPEEPGFYVVGYRTNKTRLNHVDNLYWKHRGLAPDVIQDHIAHGKSPYAAAKYLGIAPSTVYHMIKRHQIETTKPEDDEAIIALKKAQESNPFLDMINMDMHKSKPK